MSSVDPNFIFQRAQSMNQKGLELAKKKKAVSPKVLFIILGVVFAACIAVLLIFR